MSPDDLTCETFENYVIALAKFRVKSISIDSYIRGLYCFLSWLERNGHISARLRIPRPRFELELPRILNETEITKLVQLKPRSRTTRRVHAIALVCLDADCRVKEVVGLRYAERR